MASLTFELRHDQEKADTSSGGDSLWQREQQVQRLRGKNKFSIFRNRMKSSVVGTEPGTKMVGEADGAKSSRVLPFWISFQMQREDLVEFLGSGSIVKNLPAMQERVSIAGSGRSPEEGNSNPLQNTCPGNPMDRGAWWAIVHEAAKIWT